MKKRVKQLALMLIALVSLFSCEKAEQVNDESSAQKGTIIYASVKNLVQTKVDFVNNGANIDLSWADGDAFTVYGSDGNLVGDFTCIDTEKGMFENSEVTLSEGSRYTAIYPASKAATLTEAQNADRTSNGQTGEITSLDDFCKMEGSFEYKDSNITFEFNQTQAIIAMKFDKEPATITFANGDDNYSVYCSSIEAVNGIYTLYAMVKPCEAASRSLDFNVRYDSKPNIYSYSTNTSTAYEIGNCYNADITSLDEVITATELTLATVNADDVANYLSDTWNLVDFDATASEAANFDNLEAAIKAAQELPTLTKSGTNREIHLVFPNLTKIVNYAFRNNEDLKYISAPNVKAIGESTFSRCTSLTKINSEDNGIVRFNLPKVETIKSSAFYYCENITDVYFPEVKTIYYYAFEGCKKLVTANFPKVEDIASLIFDNCPNLEQITIGTIGGKDISLMSSTFAFTNEYNTVSMENERPNCTLTINCRAIPTRLKNNKDYIKDIIVTSGDKGYITCNMDDTDWGSTKIIFKEIKSYNSNVNHR